MDTYDYDDFSLDEASMRQIDAFKSHSKPPPNRSATRVHPPLQRTPSTTATSAAVAARRAAMMQAMSEGSASASGSGMSGNGGSLARTVQNQDMSGKPINGGAAYSSKGMAGSRATGAEMNGPRIKTTSTAISSSAFYETSSKTSNSSSTMNQPTSRSYKAPPQPLAKATSSRAIHTNPPSKPVQRWMPPPAEIYDVDMDDEFDDDGFDLPVESLEHIDNLARGNSTGSNAFASSSKHPFPTKQSTLTTMTTMSAMNALASSRPRPSYQNSINATNDNTNNIPLNPYTYQPTTSTSYQTHLQFGSKQKTKGKTWDRTERSKTGRRGAASKGKGKAKAKKKKKGGIDLFGDDDDDEEEEEEMEKIDGEEEELELDQFPKPFIDPSKPPAPPKHLPLSATTGTYIYPINIPKRNYQYEIVRACFLDNTLVALPTGLGKTFIAGTVLLNFYRWFPTGKLIFLMPTKPLVSQQHEACQTTCGIPSKDAATITGDDPKAWREDTWASKRVIYATPQTFLIDMVRGRLDPRDVVLVIIDEAHKASGNHSYVQCISYLTAHHQHFRIIALSATPGRSTEKVQDIIDNLHISRVEIREAEAPEISRYMFDKAIYQHVIPMSDVINDISRRWGSMMQPYIRILQGQGLLHDGNSNPHTLKAYAVTCLMSRRGTDGKSPDGKLFGTIKILSKMALGMGYLLEFSLGMFYQILKDINAGGKGTKAQPGKNAKGSIREKPEFKKIYDIVESVRNKATSKADEHPKLDKCKSLLIEHLTQDAEDLENNIQQTPTKCMVFCSYRGAVSEIVELLNEQSPLIRAHKFVGKSNSANNEGDKGLTQAEQKAVIDKFKKGVYNVLVATSIGEEGLDIGEVDFIVIYNCPRESIKMLQRVGRAGRKRDGKIHVFMTQGREDKNWNSANENHREIQAEIICGRNIELYDDVEKLLPGGKMPECREQVQEIDEWVTENKTNGGKRKRASVSSRAPTKKKARGDAIPDGAMDGFVFASALTTKGKKIKPGAGKKKASWDESSDSEEVEETEHRLPSGSQMMRNPDESFESISQPQLKPKKIPKPSTKSRAPAAASKKTEHSPLDSMFDDTFTDNVGCSSEEDPLAIKPQAKAKPGKVAKLDADVAKQAGFSQIDTAWMLADGSDDEFNHHHINSSVLAKPFKPPSFARPSLSRNMPPPSVPQRVLTAINANNSPSTDPSPIPVRRRKKGKAPVQSSPDTPSSRLPERQKARDISPVVRAAKPKTKARPTHGFIDFEVGVSDDEDEGAPEDDSSGEESESDRRFAGRFEPTQAPKGYNQRAAYAAGLSTQAGPSGPAFESRSHLREAFFAKARRPVYLSQEEAREGPSSEYDGSFVCGDDTVEFDTDDDEDALA